jgi:hypothetical protein
VVVLFVGLYVCVCVSSFYFCVCFRSAIAAGIHTSQVCFCFVCVTVAIVVAAVCCFLCAHKSHRAVEELGSRWSN